MTTGPLGGTTPRTVSTVDALVDDVGRTILDGTLPAGHSLRDSVLAAEYRVSRHTLRAALSRLEHVGLLEYHPNHGWSVPSLTKDDYRDIRFLRLGLEVQALREVALRADGVGDRGRAALAAIVDVDDDAGWLERIAIDEEFHRALVDRAASPRLSAAHRTVQLVLRLYLVQRPDSHHQSREVWRESHRQIVDAVESGDPDRVERVMRTSFAMPSAI